MSAAWQAAAAATPLAAILVAMLALRWSAARAGLLGLALAAGVAWFGFGFGSRTFAHLGPALAMGGALLEAAFLAATILWIVFPALCIHELQLRTGAVEVLQRAMARLSGDPRILALLIAWFFVLFVEGAAGFGTSAALAAPFLVVAGFGRVEAVTISLIGHAAGVSFGAVGTPLLAQAAITPFDGRELAAATAVYHSVAGALLPLVVMLLVTRALPASERVGAEMWGWALFAAAAFLVPHHLIATYVGPELPTLGGALIGAGAFVAALRRSRRGAAVRDDAGPGSARLAWAAAPYLVLVALVLATRLWPPLSDALANASWTWTADAFGGSFAPLYHPGTLLLAGFAVGAAWQRAPRTEVGAAVAAAAGRLLPVTVALLAMLGLSRVTVHAGMIEALAETAAATAGGTWPLLAPFVGVLGTFVTGSATASNILLTDFQLATATRLDLAGPAILGAQGFGAAVGNIVCPHNVIAAGATVALSGREGEVLRRTFGVALAYALAGGLLALFAFT